MSPAHKSSSVNNNRNRAIAIREVPADRWIESTSNPSSRKVHILREAGGVVAICGYKDPGPYGTCPPPASSYSVCARCAYVFVRDLPS